MLRDLSALSVRTHLILCVIAAVVVSDFAQLSARASASVAIFTLPERQNPATCDRWVSVHSSNCQEVEMSPESTASMCCSQSRSTWSTN